MLDYQVLEIGFMESTCWRYLYIESINFVHYFYYLPLAKIYLFKVAIETLEKVSKYIHTFF